MGLRLFEILSFLTREHRGGAVKAAGARGSQPAQVQHDKEESDWMIRLLEANKLSVLANNELRTGAARSNR